MRIRHPIFLSLTAVALAGNACGGNGAGGTEGFGDDSDAGSSSGSSGSTGSTSGGRTDAGGMVGSTSSSSSGGASGSGGSSDASASSSGSQGDSGSSSGGSDAGSSSGGSSGGSGSSSGSEVDAGSSSDSGSSFDAGPPTICNFASGLNVAWVNFADDVPNPNVATFQTIFKNTYAAGGRIARWWFHTNGTVTPGYDSSGKALKLQQSHIDGLKSILSAAHAAGVAVNISLWSFDMLQSDAGSAHTNNQALLENDTNRQAYIDNYLTPLVTALKGTPGLYSWEIFNEPEGMGPNGWATYRTTEAYIQKTVNWFAAAIHTADPSALVTNASVTFDYCSGASGKNNYYSDSALRAAGGKQNGTLDYYEVHYYTSNGASDSCFTHSAASWKLDKKLVMGEFAAQATDGVALNNLYTNLYSSGYDGAWAWSYDADWPWPAMKVPMQDLYTAHADVGTCP
jgi:hypothetical protein